MTARARRRAGVAVLAAALLAASAGGPLAAPPGESVEQGRRLYEIYCLNCHGRDGRGDGPTAQALRTHPADLTLLARGGESFPRDRVYRAIDGREMVPSHGRSEMPLWGLAFQEPDRDTNQEGAVRARILSLIDYLESIQRAD